jgi:predicted metal-binding membrane protein
VRYSVAHDVFISQIAERHPRRAAMSRVSDEHALDALPRAAGRLGRALARPVPIAIACVLALVGLGWLWLAVMVAAWAARGEAGALGPGMGILDLLARRDGVDLIGRALVEVLCRPGFGAQGSSETAGQGALVFAMWSAMTLAMMLPTAAGMIVTYAQIADTAARKAEPAVSPLVLMVGYVSVWLGFALLATLLQAALTRAALLDSAMASANPLFSGAVFIGAGAYQFTALKHACVRRCQRPFPFFFANWSSEPRGVFRLGVRQGLFCLGCCWAAMLAMFAVGVMNVVWMAALGAVMTLEKMMLTTRFSQAVGLAFVAIGAAFIAVSVAAHWPT